MRVTEREILLLRLGLDELFKCLEIDPLDNDAENKRVIVEIEKLHARLVFADHSSDDDERVA